MTTVYAIKSIWSGFPGAPGYTTHHFSGLVDVTSTNNAAARIKAYWDTLRVYMRTDWSIQVQASVDEFDMATGALTGNHTITVVPAASVGSLATTVVFAGGAGSVTLWKTGLIFNRRRVQGRTFNVPQVSCFDVDGTLTSGYLTAVNAGAAGMITSTGADFCIWARQFNNATPPVQIGGALASVTSGSVKDATSGLRSRRT